MTTKEDLSQICLFIAEYATHLMGAGVHTSRAVRNSKRIASAFDVQVNIGVFHSNIIITVIDNKTQKIWNEMVDIPARPISFELNSELSALSWDVGDKNLSLEQLKARYQEIISAPKINPLFVILMVGLANASFCRLFGGDFISMGIVFSSTIIGVFMRQLMHRRGYNKYVIFATAAFIASLCTSTSLIFDTTSEIALATSILFLVPGVPLINGVIDVLEGYIITGFCRLTEALLIIISISLGLSLTLILVKNSLI